MFSLKSDTRIRGTRKLATLTVVVAYLETHVGICKEWKSREREGDREEEGELCET